MTIEEALSWCKENGADISFNADPGGSLVRVRCGDSRYVEDEDFVTAVERLRELIAFAQVQEENRPVDNTPLEALQYEGRNTRGRVMRVARALRVETVGELIEWAEGRPRGLREIISYRNIGEQSLNSLVDALEAHGVTDIPLGPEDTSDSKMAA